MAPGGVLEGRERGRKGGRGGSDSSGGGNRKGGKLWMDKLLCSLPLSMIVAVNAAMGMSKRRSSLEMEVLLSVDAAGRRRKVTD